MCVTYVGEAYATQAAFSRCINHTAEKIEKGGEGGTEGELLLAIHVRTERQQTVLCVADLSFTVCVCVCVRECVSEGVNSWMCLCDDLSKKILCLH